MDDVSAMDGTPLSYLETVMNHLRDEITDAAIELVYSSFPNLSETQFRAIVHQVLRIVDHAVCEVLRNERHLRYLTNLKPSKN